MLSLLTIHAAAAHRPYFTQAETVILPDGRPGEMRLLWGDGILFPDPGRILVLDAEQRLLARSHRSVTMALLCDRALRSCQGYDGNSIITLDPTSFRPGQVVPGLAERNGLLAIESAVNNAECRGIPWFSGGRKYSHLQGCCPEQARSLQIGDPVEAGRTP